MRSLLVAVAVLAGLSGLAGPATAAPGPAAPATPTSAVPPTAFVGVPVDPYATYQPQTRCRKKPKPGTVALGDYLVATYGGSGGAVNRPCTGSSISEHKDGRAVDWTLDADVPADRARAQAFLDAAFATDVDGNPNALARRMGIMYVIWDDTMYAAYDGFVPKPYLSSSCRKKAKCSKTLRHRDHVHLSLSKPGARGQTTFYPWLSAQAVSQP